MVENVSYFFKMDFVWYWNVENNIEFKLWIFVYLVLDEVVLYIDLVQFIIWFGQFVVKWFIIFEMYYFDVNVVNKIKFVVVG